MKKSIIFSLVLGLFWTLGFCAYAAEFPAKPITLQVAYPPGGSTDVGARIVAAIAEKAVGQPIVVVNKGGAGGQVGWTELAHQKPDGYYLGIINLPHLPSAILDPERKATFKGEDIVPIISQALDPTTISVKPESPWKTLKDLTTTPKKGPAKFPPVSWATSRTMRSVISSTPRQRA